MDAANPLTSPSRGHRKEFLCKEKERANNKIM